MPSDQNENGNALASPERLRWLDEITQNRRDLIRFLRPDVPELPMLFRSEVPLFREHFGPTGGDLTRLFLYIEGDLPMGVEALGETLVAFGRGVKRLMRPSVRSQVRVSVEMLGIGSVWIRVVLPVAAFVVGVASFANDLYGTFAGGDKRQQALAQCTSTLILDDNATAVTIVGDAGHTVLRIDPASAAAYRQRRLASRAHAQQIDTTKPLPPLEVPAAIRPEEPTAGSGIVRRVNGLLYVELLGIKGMLVRIFDHRSTQSPLVDGGRYNFDGQFEIDNSGFPTGYVITSALLLERTTGRR